MRTLCASAAVNALDEAGEVTALTARLRRLMPANELVMRLCELADRCVAPEVVVPRDEP